MVAPDLVGLRFGRLTVKRRVENNSSGSSMWECVCDCGEIRVNAGTSLRAGRNKSCGCSSPRFDADRLTTHGKSRTRTYKIWAGMISRCKPGRPKSHLYFAKGVRVCRKWKTFENFLRDMGEAPDGLTIERKDGNGNYCPSNCCWATRTEQANNTTRNRIVFHDGRSMTVSQWANELGINPNTLLYRFRRGWATERALNVTLRRLLA